MRYTGETPVPQMMVANFWGAVLILMKDGILRFVNVIWIPAERLPE